MGTRENCTRQRGTWKGTARRALPAAAFLAAVGMAGCAKVNHSHPPPSSQADAGADAPATPPAVESVAEAYEPPAAEPQPVNVFGEIDGVSGGGATRFAADSA